ncbi:class I SAM-dependent methyltransferase [Niallia sp. 01092]|uniref:class I SAM-dependent methyltransferase n=1 Tax=unclassified Niallia TaxID=2837522 RepID=UPI003FD63CA6
MIVTTAGRTDANMISLAKEIAEELQFLYIERTKKSVDKLKKEYNDDVLVIGKNRYELFIKDSQQPFFFHPNSAVFRIKRIQKKEHDPFAEATNIRKGSSFLDCTVGLGSDSIVASYVTGKEGRTEGNEASKVLSFLVKKGLHAWKTDSENINDAMQRITVNNRLALSDLKSRKEGSVDCVYFDPMFETEILSSDGINPLRKLAVYDDLTKETVEEAIRVAKDRVVLKDHFRSKRFEQFGFSVLKRKSAKFHYGIILKNANVH